MWNIDAWMFDFISKNWFTTGLVFGVLKILARSSKNVLDDKIMTFLGQSLKLIKKESDKELPEPDKD